MVCLVNWKRREFLSVFAGGFLSPLIVSKGIAGAKVPRTHGPITRTVVRRSYDEVPGTIVISNSKRTLDVVLDKETVARYKIAIGRKGFTWTGTVIVGSKRDWPEWRPPAEMRKREPDLPEMVPPGPYNPLGARAIYLFRGGRDTLYRIHGTNDAGSVGEIATAGCFRMTNADILELYKKVSIGTKVVVNE